MHFLTMFGSTAAIFSIKSTFYVCNMVIFNRKFLDFALRAGTNPGNTPNPYFPYVIPYFLFFLFPPYSAQFGRTASLVVLEILPPQVVTVSPLPSERLKVPQKSTCSICFSCIWCTWTWATIFGRIDTNEVLRTSGMTLYKSISPYT